MNNGNVIFSRYDDIFDESLNTNRAEQNFE